MSAPKFPADEALKSWIALVHQRAAPRATECERISKVRWLAIVENIAFSIVSSRTARGLVSELWASFYGQRLIGIHERFAYRKLARIRRF